MKVLKNYWWLLLVLITVTLIFIINYKGIVEPLEWTGKPVEVLGKLAVKLIVVGALLDQFIAVFFPESEDVKMQRIQADAVLSNGREKKRILRREIIQERLNLRDDMKSEGFRALHLELDNAEQSIRNAEEILTEIYSNRIGFVRMVAFAFSLVLAVAGITVLTDFIAMPAPAEAGLNYKIVSYLDIILTAALLSGGTSGINQFFKVVKDSWKRNGNNT